MSQASRGDAKRAALMKATADVIMEKGLAGATTREIAERAGSTERTLFKQFGNKEGLVRAVLDEASTIQFDVTPIARLRSDPPRTLDGFEAWDREFIADRQRSPAASDVGRLFLVEVLQNPAFKARFGAIWTEKMYRPLVACLDGLKAAGEIDPEADTGFLARAFVSLHLGYLIARLNIAPDRDWDTERDAAQLAAGFRKLAEKR